MAQENEMRYAILDPMDEGYMALAISVILGSTIDNSFKVLCGEEIHRYRNGWTDEDYEEMMCMRNGGMSWGAIGSLYGIDRKTASNAMKRWLSALR